MNASISIPPGCIYASVSLCWQYDIEVECNAIHDPRHSRMQNVAKWLCDWAIRDHSSIPGTTQAQLQLTVQFLNVACNHWNYLASRDAALIPTSQMWNQMHINCINTHSVICASTYTPSPTKLAQYAQRVGPSSCAHVESKIIGCDANTFVAATEKPDSGNLSRNDTGSVSGERAIDSIHMPEQNSRKSSPLTDPSPSPSPPPTLKERGPRKTLPLSREKRRALVVTKAPDESSQPEIIRQTSPDIPHSGTRTIPPVEGLDSII